jgi:hypothetical protein
MKIGMHMCVYVQLTLFLHRGLPRHPEKVRINYLFRAETQ